MENQVSLDAVNYDEVLRILFILKDICNDVDIQEGIIRQRSNDNATVFEIDINSLISNLSLPISELKNKLDIFKSFAGDEVTISTDDVSFTIKDQYSMLKIKNPILDFMDNRFISSDELTSVISVTEDDLILSTKISKKISDRMRIISNSFHVNSIHVILKNNNANITCSTQSKDNFANFVDNITINKEMDHSSNLIITPFIIDHDGDIDFEMYDSGNNTVLNVFKTSIGSINLTLYSRASLVEEGENHE